MSRIRKALMLAILVVLALIGPCVVGTAESGTDLNLPDVLPDGSTMASVRDVFTEVADETTAHELRSHMPHVLGGTEYRYVLEKDGQVEAEWGIVVFEFENEQVALEDFQHLANEVAFVNKNPRFVRIPGAENVPEIKEFLESDLPYACLMNEIVIFRKGKHIVWVDDYQVVFEATDIKGIEADPGFARCLQAAVSISSVMYSRTTAALSIQEAQPAHVSTSTTSATSTGSIRLVVTNHEGKAIEWFHKDSNALPFLHWSKDIYARVSDEPFAALGQWEFPAGQPPMPVAPQDFNTYETVVPGVWYAVYSVASDSVDPIQVSSMASGIQEAVISGLGPGRYLIQCGTTIQVDETEVVDTGVKVPPEGGTPEGGFPAIPLVGHDEKGHWETFRLKKIGEHLFDVGGGLFEKHYTYEIRKRYTYNVMSSAVTELGSGEIEAGKPDNAFVCLLTNPDALATFCGHVSYSPYMQDETEMNLDKTLKNSAVTGAGALGLGKTFKWLVPLAGTYGPGLLATEIANLVYLGCTQPDTNLDEDFLVKFGASLAVTAFAIKISSAVGAAVGGPAGLVAGYVVGVAGTTLVEETLGQYRKGQLREKAAEAFFDDVTVCLERDENNVVTHVGIACAGTTMFDPYLAEAFSGSVLNRTADYFEGVCVECFPEMPWTKLEVSPYAGLRLGFTLNPECQRDPLFGDWASRTAVLVVDVPLVATVAPPSSLSDTWLISNLTWCLNDMAVECEETPIEKALEWLRTKQNPENGSWNYGSVESVGITALATLAFLNAGYDATDQNVKNGLGYIVSKYNSTEGWISVGDIKQSNDEVLVYDTALAVLPLIFARHVDYTPPAGSQSLQAVLKGAARYLVNQQSMDTSNPDSYGGWGYPRNNWADLSNTQWALLALETIRREAGITASMPNWNAAATFVARCWKADGGFAYQPKGSSYGSMTGAGVWSLLICGWNGVSTIQLAPGNSVSLAEPVQRGLDWLSMENEVKANPGLDSGWYYYYLVTVAKTYLFAEGNIGLDWYNDMASYLVQQLQKGDGHFSSVYGGEPDVMATAEAVLALQTRAKPPERLNNTELWIVLASHADLHVYDAEGRHVGKNYDTGQIDTEIPGASYHADGTQTIGIPRPSAGRYRIELVGTSDGEYSLTVEGQRAGKTISTKSFAGVIEEGKKRSTTATLASIVGPLTVFVGKPRPLPESLYAVPKDGQIELHWHLYADTGFQLAGYNLYRSTQSGGEYTRVNASLVAGTEYTDKGSKSWQAYYYVLTAVDKSGNETGYSPEANVMAFPQGFLEGVVRLILGILQAILSLFGL